jgi:hypothetical protein
MKTHMAAAWLVPALLASSATWGASTTEILPLSGMGEANETPVYWDFRLDTGRGSGQRSDDWRRIVVPSQWEQQGFGRYYYGTQGRGKPDDDPVIPKETGTYKRTFEVPASWRDRDVHVVFEASMTDTTVFINGTQAGDTHQGGFYRFSYDITKWVKIGTNAIEVRVAKESANASVNHAERRGDYWTFGGIFRPVWLEARPRHHIVRTAIDARADGRFAAHVYFDEPMPRGTLVSAQVLTAAGEPLGAPLMAPAGRGDHLSLEGTFASPALWTAETPNLHTVKLTARQGRRTLHEYTQRFGFRTVEVRPNDGVYLNGRKIVLKGVNRHSFRPATGRTLTREQNYADARLIKAMNMNAVRMSHYPPDPAFLEAADELGLYVLNELAGWQGFYDTPTGARLIGQIVRRDVNHPSILFWDNGNEGGWNTANDGEFARWDPQRRPVLHPWAIHSDINTDHYEKYDSTVKLSAGPQIFMPTEFLHGLYDGGIGAGFEDYWRVMGASPTVAGGFFWAFADEGIERTDRDGRIDNMGNAAPDGIVGPHHEKEASFFTVKQIWSPVQVSDLALSEGALRMRLRNDYDFNSLDRIEFEWRVVRMPAAGAAEHPRERAAGRARGPGLAARQQTEWSLPVNVGELGPEDVLELTAVDASGLELWTWTLVGAPRQHAPLTESKSRRIIAKGRRVTAGPWRLEFGPVGELLRLENAGRDLGLRGPAAIAFVRDERGFRPVDTLSKSSTFDITPRGEPDVIARLSLPRGVLRSLTWRLVGEELRLDYELHAGGDVDILGIRFDHPTDSVLSKRWLGEGPYRVWKNRLKGTRFGLHEVTYNDPLPGESFEYPEFPGFFGAWRWLDLHTRDVTVRFRNVSGIPYHGLHRPQPGAQPVITLPDLGWSFLHVIPPIGTKFDLPGTLGPQSDVTRVGVVRGELALSADAAPRAR